MDVFQQSRRALAPEVAILMGPPSSYKSDIAAMLEVTQNWKHVDGDDYISKGMSDQDCVSAITDNLIRMQNKNSRFLLEHFPRNLNQAKLFSVQ